MFVLSVSSASGGELQMLLDKDEVPEERQVKRLMRQILDGLIYLHSINVAHLDIKVRWALLVSEIEWKFFCRSNSLEYSALMKSSNLITDTDL